MTLSVGSTFGNCWTSSQKTQLYPFNLNCLPIYTLLNSRSHSSTCSRCNWNSSTWQTAAIAFPAARWLNPIFDAIVATEICAVPCASWNSWGAAWADMEAGALSRIVLEVKPKTTRVSDPRIEQVTPLWFDSVDFLLPLSQPPHTTAVPSHSHSPFCPFFSYCHCCWQVSGYVRIRMSDSLYQLECPAVVSVIVEISNSLTRSVTHDTPLPVSPCQGTWLLLCQRKSHLQSENSFDSNLISRMKSSTQK